MMDGNSMPAVLVTLTLAIGIFFIKNYAIGRRGSKVAGKRYPPSLPSLPLVGSLPFVAGGMDVLPEFFMKTAEKLGSVFTFYAGSRLAVVLNGKEAITDAMMKQKEAFADRPDFWTEANYLNRELRGIGFAHYTETYKKNHKLSVMILKEFGNGSSKITEERILLEAQHLIEEFRGRNGSPFSPRVSIVRSTASVLISILFGRRFLSTQNGHHTIIDNANEYLENVDPAIDIAPLVRFLPMYRKKIAAMAHSKEGLMKGIEEGIALNKSPDVEFTFVRRFLENEGSGYNHQDLLYIIRDFCLGGSETVSSTLLWGFVELANHPEVQSRMQREIDTVISGDRYPSLEDKEHLPYTEAVILELMRRRTVVPLSVPHATLKDTTASGYFVPRGCLVLKNIFGMHMDPKTWTDPETFQPKRFLDEENKVVGRDRIIPFGVGRRRCIAEFLGRQEIFLFLTSIVQHFKILPPEGQEPIKVKAMCGLTVYPSHFEVRMIPRMKE